MEQIGSTEPSGSAHNDDSYQEDHLEKKDEVPLKDNSRKV